MPSEVSWFREPRIIRSRAFDEISLDETIEVGEKIDAMMSAGVGPVHHLIDVTEMTRFPTSISGLKRALVYIDNPNCGQVVVYGGSSLAITFAQIIFRMLNARYRLFNTEDEALDFLAEQDPSLQPADPGR